jgi:hypothetical protein
LGVVRARLKRQAQPSTEAVDKSVEQGWARRVKPAEERGFLRPAQEAGSKAKPLKSLS